MEISDEDQSPEPPQEHPSSDRLQERRSSTQSSLSSLAASSADLQSLDRKSNASGADLDAERDKLRKLTQTLLKRQYRKDKLAATVTTSKRDSRSTERDLDHRGRSSSERDAKRNSSRDKDRDRYRDDRHDRERDRRRDRDHDRHRKRYDN